MPKRVPVDARRDKQVLLRLTARQIDWLEGAAYLEHVGVSQYVFDLVSRHVDALTGSEPVKQAVSLRREYDAATATTTPLATRPEGDDQQPAEPPDRAKARPRPDHAWPRGE